MINTTQFHIVSGRMNATRFVQSLPDRPVCFQIKRMWCTCMLHYEKYRSTQTEWKIFKSSFFTIYKIDGEGGKKKKQSEVFVPFYKLTVYVQVLEFTSPGRRIPTQTLDMEIISVYMYIMRLWMERKQNLHRHNHCIRDTYLLQSLLCGAHSSREERFGKEAKGKKGEGDWGGYICTIWSGTQGRSVKLASLYLQRKGSTWNLSWITISDQRTSMILRHRDISMKKKKPDKVILLYKRHCFVPKDN